MTRTTARALTITLAIAGALTTTASAQTDPFAFIPPGGKTLLLRVIASAPPRAETAALLSSKRTPADWKTYLRSRVAAMPALRTMNDSQLATLAAYLAIAGPIREADLPRGTDAAAWTKVLPPDGRELALTKCQNCHIITVVVTQEKDPRGWRGLLQTPNHTKVLGGAAQEEMLGQYLAIIAPIPIEQIPPPLRAGGASY